MSFFAVGFYDWMLALHLLAAFSLAAGFVLFSVLVVVGKRAQTLEQTQPLFRLGPIGTPLVGAGMVLALILGIVLAIDSDDYQVWDLWVLAAIALWLLAGFTGQRTGVYYNETQKLAESGGPGAEAEVLARLRAPTGARLHYVTLALIVLLLLDMIFKPGA